MANTDSHQWQNLIRVSPMTCRVSGRGEGLALRGLFILLILPLGLYVIWKRKKR